VFAALSFGELLAVATLLNCPRCTVDITFSDVCDTSYHSMTDKKQKITKQAIVPWLA